jgi:hypothetical protein
MATRLGLGVGRWGGGTRFLSPAVATAEAEEEYGGIFVPIFFLKHFVPDLLINHQSRK